MSIPTQLLLPAPPPHLAQEPNQHLLVHLGKVLEGYGINISDPKLASKSFEALCNSIVKAGSRLPTVDVSALHAALANILSRIESGAFPPSRAAWQQSLPSLTPTVSLDSVREAARTLLAAVQVKVMEGMLMGRELVEHVPLTAQRLLRDSNDGLSNQEGLMVAGTVAAVALGAAGVATAWRYRKRLAESILPHGKKAKTMDPEGPIEEPKGVPEVNNTPVVVDVVAPTIVPQEADQDRVLCSPIQGGKDCDSSPVEEYTPKNELCGGSAHAGQNLNPPPPLGHQEYYTGPDDYIAPEAEDNNDGQQAPVADHDQLPQCQPPPLILQSATSSSRRRRHEAKQHQAGEEHSTPRGRRLDFSEPPEVQTTPSTKKAGTSRMTPTKLTLAALPESEQVLEVTGSLCKDCFLADEVDEDKYSPEEGRCKVCKKPLSPYDLDSDDETIPQTTNKLQFKGKGTDTQPLEILSDSEDEEAQ